MSVVLRVVASWAVSVAVLSVAAPAGVSAQEPAPVPSGDVPEDADYFEPVQALAEVGIFEGIECAGGFCPDGSLGSAWLQSSGGSEPKPYGDVSSTNSHAQDIARLEDLGIFDGTECGLDQFCPGDPLSRRTFAVWMVRVLDGAQAPGFVNPGDGGGSRFADVAADEAEVLFIERLAELEVTAGCGSKPLRYCPDRSVSRSQMASFLSRAFDLPAAEAANFTDVDSDSVHYDDINRLAASEITVGCSSQPKLYCPDSPTTRGQMASFLARAIDLQNAREGTTPTGYDDSIGLSVTYDNEEYEATVAWSQPLASRGPVEQYILQSRTVLGDYSPEFSQRIEHQTNKSNYQTVVSNSTNTNHLYAFRMIVAYANGERLATSEVKTPSDVHKFRDVIWEVIVEPNQGEQPWLADTWIHMGDSQRFGLAFGARTTLNSEYPRPTGLERQFASGIAINSTIIENQSTYYTRDLVEEMGHVYTLTNDINKNPAPIGVGHLYIHLLEVEHVAGAQMPSRCSSSELYGDMAKMVFWDRYSDFDASFGLLNYRGDAVSMSTWRACGLDLDPATRAEVNREIPRIARSVFVDQQMPQWFYDNYQKSGGDIDLEKLWADITVDMRYRQTMGLIAYHLKDEFGGYCSEEQVRKFIEGGATGITNPWNDGGCEDSVFVEEASSPTGSGPIGPPPVDDDVEIVEGQSFTRNYPRDFLSRFRNTPERCWVVVNGYAYNVTQGDGGYEYPAPGSLNDLCGQDASRRFESDDVPPPGHEYLMGSVRD